MSVLTISDVKARCIVDPATHCWLWQRACSTDGVPRIHTLDYARGEKRVMSGPLAVWNIAHEAPPRAGHLVFRGCQNKLCLNPVHLRQAADQKAIGEHIRRLGSRVGVATESRRANLVKARLASAVTATPAETVLAIRAVANGATTNRALARLHGVSEQVVSRIRLGKTHRALLDPAP